MGEALYRKHRPKKLDDVVGQPHITTTLTNAIKNGRISHGYLFSGPRGVGKTSVARILAHQVNGFDYGDSSGSLDIIEIDAASNRRIDEIRDLRDKVHTAPVAGKYKVYIIDEVHMLTREAFNALLKTLEEPPAHVIFILATTEAHKLPETIISRTQRYTFKAVPQTDVIGHLKNLANQENITISDEALRLIAEHGEGSFRDSISMLDQLSALDHVQDNDVRQLLGLPPAETIDLIFDATTNGDVASLIHLLEEAYINGVSTNQIALALIDKIRSSNNIQNSKELVNLARQLLETNSSSDPVRYLELTLIGYIMTGDNITSAVAKGKQTVNQIKTEISSTSVRQQEEPNHTPINHNEEQTVSVPQKSQPKSSIQPSNESIWHDLLDTLKKKHNTLYGVARMAKPAMEDDILVLSVPYAFHQKRLKEEKNAAIIRKKLAEFSGRPVEFKVEVITEAPNIKNETTDLGKTSDTLEAVTKIFGGGEVLET